MCKTVSHQLSTHHQSSGRFFCACKDMEYFSMMQEKGQKNVEDDEGLVPVM
jgi:hypothetical protein